MRVALTTVNTARQLELFSPGSAPFEEPRFYRDQLITYIGNKRSLLEPISRAMANVQAELGKERLRILDGFAGSGVVSRLFKSVADELVVNDLEPYARVIGNCFLANRSSVDESRLAEVVANLNRQVNSGCRNGVGFIEGLYAPKDDDSIQVGERVFYTRDNARRLDHFRMLIDDQDPDLFDLLLGPLLSAASVHANTAGVFKGFYKDKMTGRGKFGGSGADALHRIKGKITLNMPVLSNFECASEVYQKDTNDLVAEVGDFDLAYFDPPYNQHPYGSNYFMLNLLVDHHEPRAFSKVSGIPADWNRSAYNQRRRSLERLTDAVNRVHAQYVLLSFNDEGFIAPTDLRRMLGELGPVREVKLKHNTFRGSRNLHARRMHVTEHLFLVRKETHLV